MIKINEEKLAQVEEEASDAVEVAAQAHPEREEEEESASRNVNIIF